MPQIETAIGLQAFELVRARIAEILADELPNQSTLNSDPELDATVFVERFARPEAKECPIVNVCLLKGKYNNQDQTGADGVYDFAVDAYAKSKGDAGNDSSTRADSQALFKLQRLLGVVRTILNDSRYKTLGFEPPFIGWRQVTDIEIQNPTDAPGSESMVMGRIVISVRVRETGVDLDPQLIKGYDTYVKLYLTDEGYVYSGNCKGEFSKAFSFAFRVGCLSSNDEKAFNESAFSSAFK
jgi:hypothetical protein